ncbi:MAG: helix-turn-helix transcriptional regulator [Polyangiaceae bacterium]
MPKLEQTRPTGNGRARGLVSSRSSGRRVESTTFAPPPDLRDVVETLWTGRWDLPADAPHTTELLSDPSVHFVFEAAEQLDSDNIVITNRTESRLVGVWTKLWRRTLAGRGFVRGVKLRPGALRAFADASASLLSNRIVPLFEVFGAGVAELERAVLSAREHEAGFEPLIDWLRARRRLSPESRLAIAMVERIGKDATITTVEALARAFDSSPRALQRLFRDAVGASPKWVIVRARLQEVALRLERGDAPSLAALAAELGYADQAHLARDFKRVVGKSPSAFAVLVHR